MVDQGDYIEMQLIVKGVFSIAEASRSAPARDPKGACGPKHHDGRVSEIPVSPPGAEGSIEDRAENVEPVSKLFFIGKSPNGHSRVNGNPAFPRLFWMPAFASMTAR